MTTTIRIQENTSDDTGRLESVSISWNAIGSVSIQEARDFIEALNQKIEEAEAIEITN